MVILLANMATTEEFILPAGAESPTIGGTELYTGRRPSLGADASSSYCMGSSYTSISTVT